MAARRLLRLPYLAALAMRPIAPPCHSMVQGLGKGSASCRPYAAPPERLDAWRARSLLVEMPSFS